MPGVNEERKLSGCRRKLRNWSVVWVVLEVFRSTSFFKYFFRQAIKARNQLHVFNSLFRMEQKRNDELSCQLKRSLEDITNAKSSCEILTTSLISLGADKELLQQQIDVKDQEIENLNSLISQANTNLFKVMTEQRELQANFSMEQRKVQSLENEKNELINKVIMDWWGRTLSYIFNILFFTRSINWTMNCVCLRPNWN